MSKPTSKPIVVATSLAPTDERGVQPAAISSWLDHGCTVLSVNTADEIAALEGSFPGVTFIKAERTAERFAGRPVPYIFDLLQAAKTHAEQGQVIGITNADIFLRPIKDLSSFVQVEAQGCVLLGPRVDVSDVDAFSTYAPDEDPTYSVGYDYFLMSREVADHFEDSPFAMGMPFWDFWLPLTAHLAGCPLKTLHAPVALHVAHETRWDDTIYLFFHALIAYALDQSRKDLNGDTAEQRQLKFMLDVVSHVYGNIFENGTSAQEGQAPDANSMTALAEFYDRFQETAVHTIKTSTQNIRPDNT